MKKTELIHVHNLLGTVATKLHEDGAITQADLAGYQELGTSPMTMRGSRKEHERAVLALSESLAAGIERTESDRRDVTRSAQADDAERAESDSEVAHSAAV